MSTGVYCILNKVNGKLYIGSAAKSITKRLWTHRRLLALGQHLNSHLQSAWRKYGEKSFEFRIIESCSSDLCIEREQHWINYYQSFIRERGYNKSPTAGSPLGVVHSEETRKTVSHSLLGKKKSVSHSSNIRRAKKLIAGSTITKMALAARKRGPNHYLKMVETRKQKKGESDAEQEI